VNFFLLPAKFLPYPRKLNFLEIQKCIFSNLFPGRVSLGGGILSTATATAAASSQAGDGHRDRHRPGFAHLLVTFIYTTHIPVAVGEYHVLH
jgi:hypothetical protein